MLLYFFVQNFVFFQMQRLFYQNYKNLNGSVDPEENKYDIKEAITLHPFKNHTYLYQMQQYVHKQKMISLQRLEKKIEKDKSILLAEHLANGTQNLQTNKVQDYENSMDSSERQLVNKWTAYKGKSYFSHAEFNPKHAIEEPYLKNLIDTIFESEKQYGEEMRKYGEIFYVKNFEFGYKHISHFGIQYILHLKVCCPKAKNRTLADQQTYWIRRNLSFLDVSEDKAVASNNSSKQILHFPDRFTEIEIFPLINFIIPLSGKLLPFLRFIKIFERSFLKQEKQVSLLVVLFWNYSNQKESWEIISSIKQLKRQYFSFHIELIQRKGEFSRGIALNVGASMFKEDDLLFFLDVDCFIHPDILKRIMFNTIQHKQAYFPIMFSLYNPQYVWHNEGNFNNCTFTDEMGYWRFHSYGQLSVYKSDFSHIGGYDSTIRGWGKEDIDLFQKFLDKGITPFRAPDPGLIHIFHDVHCGLGLPHEQYRMCLGTKWSTFGCQKTLSNIVYSTKEIFDRNKDI